jgi:acetyl-CoA carboxylase biotin carboxyl carrier protein
MLDIRKLKELIRLMVANELTELDLRDEQQQVTIRRPGPGQEPQLIQAAPPVMVAAPAAVPAPAAAAPVATADSDEGTTTIESPMVGTFYSAPAPDKSPFISVGDTVDEDTVVCIVEAMKIFNEIKAETTGTVEKMLAKSGDAVEFGQPLFLIRPS